MPPSRYIRLTEEEDVRLRQIEQAPHYFKPKVRLRAQVLRLSHRGSNVRTISAYTGRSRASIGRDLDRWEERGFEGFLDGTARATRRASPRRRGPSWKASSPRKSAPGMLPSFPRLSERTSERTSEWRSRPKPSANTS